MVDDTDNFEPGVKPRGDFKPIEEVLQPEIDVEAVEEERPTGRVPEDWIAKTTPDGDPGNRTGPGGV